ncbi:MAG: exodeoxyribonuclease V subunit gamma [Burkholderia sp.]|nr:exodeoxyribonuclease V subunit gamma [Burkholderia sp.]
MINLFESNHYETLTAALLDDIEISQDRGELWMPWQIIVPSSAVQRRLELDIASRYGICANVKFSYLEQWLWEQISCIYRYVPRYSPFIPERLVWRCYRLLCGVMDNYNVKCNIKSTYSFLASPRLARYLSDSDETMRYELAHRVATVINYYLIYQPEWLSAWQTGESILENGITQYVSESVFDDEQWQAALWRAIVVELFTGEMLPVYNFLFEGLESKDTVHTCLPKSVSIFALPIIPPLHTVLLRKFSTSIDIRIYSLNPCREFWFDIKNEESREEELDLLDQQNYQKIHRHPLLTKWGQQIKYKQHMLHKLIEAGVVSRKKTYFVENCLPTWLARIQNSILNLQDELTFSEPPDIYGIEIHVCHSLTRQLEVLHNRLLKFFNEDESLKPSDVLIAIPNLSMAEPFINMVFGTSNLERMAYIPYRITGLKTPNTNLIIRAILSWLTLPDRKVCASELIEWLRIDEIAARYKIDEVDLEIIKIWLSRAGGRLGLSGSHHDDIDVNSNTPRHTFSDALERLFLGYAMQDGAAPIGTCLPINLVKGSDVELLGRLSCFIENLDRFSYRIAQVHTPNEWSNILNDMLSCFFDFSPVHLDILDSIRDTLNSMFDAMAEVAADQLIPFAVVRAGLISAFDMSKSGEGVPYGCVTFSSMTSLRGLTYRIICLLDMDDVALSSYLKHTDEFDLIAVLKKFGDQQRFDDDRSLFFDFLLSARDHLLITYTGRSITDNSPLPPSTLVYELLDHLSRISASSDISGDILDIARHSFIIRHPLQPFSPSYFDNTSNFFSYNSEHASIATLLIGNEVYDCRSRNITPLFSRPLPSEPAEPIKFIDFDRFWRNPTRVLLRHRLGIVSNYIQPKLLDSEPFELDYTASYILANRILPLLIESGKSSMIDHARRIINASHELPGGATGKVWRDQIFSVLVQFSEKVRHTLADGTITSPFTLEIAAKWPNVDCALFWSDDASLAYDATTLLSLYGVLNRLTPSGQVIYRYAQPEALDYISAWLAHLIYCAVLPDGPRRTLWLGNNFTFELKAVETPLQYLSSLIALFRAGRRMPLPFFPHSAWTWIKSGKTSSRTSSILINDLLARELRDPILEKAWHGIDLSFNESFFTLARFMFDPILEHLLEM